MANKIIVGLLALILVAILLLGCAPSSSKPALDNTSQAEHTKENKKINLSSDTESNVDSYIKSLNPSLYLPLWKFDGKSFMSADVYRHQYIVNGTSLVSQGIKFDVNDTITIPYDYHLDMSLFRKVAVSPNIGAHQGIATDGNYFYLFHTTFIKKVNNKWGLVAFNNNVNAECGGNHLGGGCYYNGKIYVPTENYVDSFNYSSPRISIWNASDLSFVGTHDISAQGHEAAGLFVDGPSNTIYVISNSDGAKIWKYRLSDFSYLGIIALSATIPTCQGITKHGDYFYISSDNVGGRVYQVALDGTVLGIILSGLGNSANQGLDYTQDMIYGLYDNGKTQIINTWEKRKGIDFTIDVCFSSSLLPSDISSWARIIRTDDDSISIFYKNSPPQIECKFTTAEGSSPRPVISEINLVRNAFMHVTLTYSIDGTLSLYLNGNKINVQTRVARTALSSWNWIIGDSTNMGLPMVMKYVGIYDRELTPNEIQTVDRLIR